MPTIEIADRVSFADKIHPDRALSQLIQRSLEGPRAKQIAAYLRTKERFFNSLVLATYGGSPEWLEIGNFRSTSKPDLVKQISQTALDSIGFLKLTGSERIFAIDGQHRLAGIKRSLNEGSEIGQELLPVLLVGHKTSAAGLQRTRRLFTTLNKTAVPVRKRDIIALDEDDVMAITARRLVETNSAFRDPKIAVISSQSIPTSNRVCLTTIANLYDVLKLVFSHDLGKSSDRSLRFNRPSDEQLDHYYELATSYFTAIGTAFKPVGELFASANPAKITKKHRGPHGGHLLFRPVGIDILTRVAIQFAKKHKMGLVQAVIALKNIPTDLGKPPLLGILWDSKRLVLKRKALALSIIKYIAGLEIDADRLLAEYKDALGVDQENQSVKLPARLP